MAFVHFHRAEQPPGNTDLCFAIQGDRMLARVGAEGALQFPSVADVAVGVPVVSPSLYLGRLDGIPCWSSPIPDDAAAPAGWQWHETRMLISVLSAAQMHAVSAARQLHWWQRRNMFCGQCGAPTEEVLAERARKCPRCQNVFFPSSSPAVIVAVERGDRILLAHNSHFTPGLFSLIAGFVDPGETLEQAAAREVREEVGLEISDLRYLMSQPWPFPNSLMLGFRANYVSGEIHEDGKEIERAGWFSRDSLPEVPRKGTVARRMIDAWLDATTAKT